MKLHYLRTVGVLPLFVDLQLLVFEVKKVAPINIGLFRNFCPHPNGPQLVEALRRTGAWTSIRDSFAGGGMLCADRGSTGTTSCE